MIDKATNRPSAESLSQSGARPLLLDLYCGAGGCAVGYHRAGFDVVGVDHRSQPSYPYAFVRADALQVLNALLDGESLHTDYETDYALGDFAAIHASPPCKLFTVARRVHKVNRPTLFERDEDLITPTRFDLEQTGLPFVIENVVGAQLRNPALLCGSMFGLRVRRHRLFETNWKLDAPPCRHREQEAAGPVVGVYGDGGAWTRRQPGGGGRKVVGPEAAAALGIHWTTRQPELAQAIPPAYTHLIGRQLLQVIA